LLFGKLVGGGRVDVDVVDGELKITASEESTALVPVLAEST